MKERLPENYLLEMKELLKNRRDYRYEDYIKSLQDPVRSGLRTNTLKISPQDLKKRLPLPWSPSPGSATVFSALTKNGPPGRPGIRRDFTTSRSPAP